MKPLPLILAASVLGNLVLLAILVVPRRGGDATGIAGARSLISTTNSGVSAAGDSTRLAGLFKTDDPAALRDALRAAGVPEEMVRTIVQAKIWRAYSARLRSVNAAGDPNQPYWRSNNRLSFTAEQRAEQRKMLRETQKLSRDLLGGDSPNGLPVNDRYAFLPEAKRAQLAQLEADYGDLISDVSSGMAEFPLKSDQEKLSYLEEEKKRDIDALLTPAERETLDLRTSSTAASVRANYGSILNSEDQYKAVYQLQKAYNDKWNSSQGNTDGSRAQIDFTARQQAQQQLNDQIRAVVGDAAYAQLARTRDGDYQMLNAAAQRLGLPSSTTDQVLALRTQSSEQSQLIGANTALSPEQKMQALSDLARTTEAQIRSTLGNEAADTYLQRSASWLRSLAQGNSFTVLPTGGVRTVRVAPRPKTPAPRS